jgi:hypothetical protein
MASLNPSQGNDVNPGGATRNGGSVGAGSNANVIQNSFTVNSGLYDQTATQYPIQFAPGVPRRTYWYVGPLINLADTLTGSLGLLYRLGTAAPSTATVTETSATLDQWAAAINAAFGTFCVASVIKLGTLGYLLINSAGTNINIGGSSDGVLSISSVAMVDDQDVNLNFQFVPFSTNSLALQSTSTYSWAVGIRDRVSGHLSNMSPLTSVSNLLYPSEANISIQAPIKYEDHNQVLEVYRTATGGTSLLFLGYATWTPGNVYICRDTYNDSFLNPQIVGPIAEANDPPPDGLFGLVFHSGSMWGIVGNRVYFSGGPDTTNGSGNEAWPPSNFFAFPGSVVSLLPTSSGLMVSLKDDIHIIRGVDSSSYYPDLWLAGFGISNPLAWEYDGQTLYLYTTKQQLHAMSPSQQKEIGFDIGDILAASFPAATTNLTLHRGSSLDYALYVSNGTDTIVRYDPRQKSWSPKSQPVMGVGRVKSLETTVGVNTLLLGASSGIYQRVLNDWSDNGTAYAAFATIGTMMVAEPGQVKDFIAVCAQTKAKGSIPSIWVLNNEIDPAVVPFTRLGNPVNDSPLLSPSLTLISKRWYLKSALTPLPTIVNTVQVKVQFAAENAANEVLGVYLRSTA